MGLQRREFGGVILLVGEDLDAAPLVARELGVAVASVTLSHRCTRCGSSSHGRPVIASPESLAVVGISVAHSGGVDAVAINAGGAVGVDVESIAQVARAAVAPAMINRDGIAVTARDVARLWTAKEAVLKFAGVGLRVDPGDLHVDIDGDDGRLVSWPPGLFDGAAPRIQLLAVSDDLVGAVCW